MPKQPTVDRKTMRELDRATIEDLGIPARVLMENAGRAVADEILHVLRAEKVGRAVRGTLAMRAQGEEGVGPQTLEEIEEWKESLKRVEGPVGIICGPGNNGGDGFVVARTLANHGVEARVWFIGPAEELRTGGDANANARILDHLGCSIRVLRTADDLPALQNDLADTLVLVDALFGTGLARPLEGIHREVVNVINALDKPCVAVDIPSGLDCDTGAMLGTAVLADLTVTFAIAKQGMLRGHGPDCCGRISVAEMGIPRFLIARILENR